MSGAEFTTRPVSDPPLREDFGWRFAGAVAGAGLLTLLLAYAVVALLIEGTALWGTNIPFVWGFDLINYVWWIGIANAASLFAVVLVLRRHGLRTAVNRFAEAAALAAVAAAAIYPILHLGRPWLFYWTFPYPATYQVWPNFRSTLVWDFWGIMSHVVVTGLFWYTGLIPDLATMRDRAVARSRMVQARIYGVAALGWRGSVRHWARHQAAYRLVAAMVLPMLVSAQTIVALEFATTLVPEWHQARLPLHVVATGIPSGLGVVLALAALLRGGLGLTRYIDDDDMRLLAKLTAAAALACGYLYAEALLVAVLEDATTRQAIAARAFGAYAGLYWGGALLVVVVPQLLWLKRAQIQARWAVPIGIGAAAGVWLDRFSLVAGGLLRDHLPNPAPLYVPTVPEWTLLAGTIGLFALLMLGFARFVPVVSMYETRHEESEADVP
ncbi:NrfD/PsrC family molybdoenzyme membrane anchor subunit [Falsiroseomonas tokyonensis]|uniref:NrfD/PsrC family molybdoenzyme membrane anchor subunit n=1 Tax=Falsiroseomonas tokyonensis TaxID=430521 RepID=A0ABV7BT20_9PROT|nr:NrfD/PsrC family molybdoenzyme membrane anchor subunit [Falsiroseomonas tokyonensis]MBU8537176.1 polysulfide reductase NrfD [Falsiroseomonas tokyonensis]